MSRRQSVGGALLALGVLLSAAACPAAMARGPALKTSFAAPAVRSTHEGADDLLTAGLGLAGLRGPVPELTNPENPSVIELRRRAIWQNYRGLIDVSDGTGFGRLFGPIGDVRIPGVEYLAALAASGNVGRSTLLLQIPRTFAPASACLLVVAASGSRGIYGALPTAAEWGLRHGCAVAHTDKESGFWDVTRDIGVRIDGTLTSARDDPLLSFQPPAHRASGSAETAGLAHRVLLRHANSGSNPEKDWGLHVLMAIDGAMQLLNLEFSHGQQPVFNAANVRVIAAGISNGGAAVLRAAELDAGDRIDGVVAAEPNVTVNIAQPRLRIASGDATREFAVRSLYDYGTLQGLLQPCAALAETGDSLPLRGLQPRLDSLQRAWCAQLQASGLVTGASVAEWASEARRQLLAVGIEPTALRMGLVNLQTGLWPSIASTYAAAYARSGSGPQPCGSYFAATDANDQPRALSDAELAKLFSDSNGIPPTAGINLLKVDSATTDFALAECLRAQLSSLARSIDHIQMTARTGRIPVIVLHGRDDGLISVNHSSRAWYALRQRQPHADAARYYEITGVQHFDAFLAIPGMRSLYVPMQPYLNSALDLLWARLMRQQALPPSQLWRSRPSAEPLLAAQFGALQRGASAERIVIKRGTMIVPQ